MKLLIVEDSDVTRLILCKMLATMGYEPEVARNGKEAWALFQQSHYNIVISDWVMPDMDGLALCKTIRAQKRTRYTYVILVTGLSGKASYIEGMNAGADDFLTKPIDRDQLAARLRV